MATVAPDSPREKGPIMPKLYIISPSSIARTIELTHNLMTIGRTSDNDICIQDPNVSKRHGILVRDGHDYQLHDFNSTNGTFVNGERIMAVKLQHGASLRLGPVELRYESMPSKTTVAPLGVKQPEPAMEPAAGKERGLSKRVTPAHVGRKLQTGPVTLLPGSLARPIRPPPEREA